MSSDTLIDASWLDYLLVAIYFGFVIGIACIAGSTAVLGGLRWRCWAPSRTT